jgi:hypothetical protein
MGVLMCSAQAGEWSRVQPLSGSAIPQRLIIKGKTRTYHRAAKLRLTVTGPGAVKIISRWVGTRPAGRDTSYSLQVNLGRKSKRERFTTTRSGIAGVAGSKAWVGESRTMLLTLPPATMVLSMDAPEPEVHVRVFRSEKPLRLGTLRSKGPDKYDAVERLVMQERQRKYYRGTADVPVELEIIGPTTLVVYARLEFSYDMKGIQNFGIHIAEDSKIFQTFAWSTRRSDVARYIDRDDLIPSPGQKAVLQVPRGLHHWVFTSTGGMKDVLFRFLLPERDLSKEG